MIMNMWLGIVQKVRVMENKGEGKRRHGIWKTKWGVVGTWSKKPQTQYVWNNTNFKCFFGMFLQSMELNYNFDRCFE
jgi:hypothetical protein